MKAEINITFLRSLRHVAPTDDIRYYLNAGLVEFTKDYTYYVATDGHALVMIRQAVSNSEELIGRSVIVPKRFLEQLPKVTKVAKASFIFDLVEDKREVRLQVDGKDDAIFNSIDGKFPDWRKVLNESKNGNAEPSLYQPCYVNQVYSAYREAFTNANILSLRQSGDKAGIIFPENGSEFLALLMPMRDQKATPDWINSI